MAAKKGKKFFKKTKAEIGNNSVNPREKASPKKTAPKQQTTRVVSQEERKQPRWHFPNIFRKIPEQPQKKTLQMPQQLPIAQSLSKPKKKFSWKTLFVLFLIVVGLFGNLLVGISFYQKASSYVGLLIARHDLYNQMQLWQNIAQKYPDYRDAYVKGAVLAYELGDSAKEAYFLQQLKLVDPNYTWIKTFEQLQETR